MSKDEIKHLIQARVKVDGLFETGIAGVRLFRVTEPVPCVPAVYEPCVIAILSGAKEAVLDGRRHLYDTTRYLCCPLSMPVSAGTPTASAEDALFGVYISLDQRLMTELAVEMEAAGATVPQPEPALQSDGIRLAQWDGAFTDALHRLLQLGTNELDTAVLGQGRLRELYYAILTGEAGASVRQSFGVRNAIARSIAHLSTNLNAPISIEDLAARAGMSRAVFHRKFKSATTMSPIQFVKSMRLNTAAMSIASGMTVNQAALSVGYVSASQFSREFKRVFGQSPREWSNIQRAPAA